MLIFYAYMYWLCIMHVLYVCWALNIIAHIHTCALLASGSLWQLDVIFLIRLASKMSQLELENEPSRASLLARLSNEPSRAISLP